MISRFIDDVMVSNWAVVDDGACYDAFDCWDTNTIADGAVVADWARDSHGRVNAARRIVTHWGASQHIPMVVQVV